MLKYLTLQQISFRELKINDLFVKGSTDMYPHTGAITKCKARLFTNSMLFIKFDNLGANCYFCNAAYVFSPSDTIYKVKSIRI